MLILAADTSGKHGSVALVRCEAELTRTLEIVSLQGGTFSAQLIPQIAELLSKHALTKTAIDAFAVVSGPGSFTGLRVGLAAIKALAEVLQKPIAAVSLLEVIAFELLFPHLPSPERAPLLADFARSGDKILVALDAGRNEAYIGEYFTGENLPVRECESLLTVEELVQRSREGQVRIWTPDETLVELVSARGGPELAVVVARPNAASVARLGYKKLLAGQTVSPIELDANYIRRADAEIKKPLRNPAWVRPAAIEDVPAILVLERSTPAAAHWSEATYRQIFQADAVPRVVLVIGEKEPRVQGFAVARVIGSDFELENIVVDASSQRRGFGLQLIASLARSAREGDAKCIFLEVRESNTAARALYEKYGFRVSGRRISYYSDPAEDAIAYALQL